MRAETKIGVTLLLVAGLMIGIAYAGTIGVNDLYGFTNGYGFTWLNSTNVEGTNYYLAGDALNDRLGGDYAGFGLIGDTLNTGQGANDLWDMDQNVETTSSVNFSSVEADEFYRNSVNYTAQIEGLIAASILPGNFTVAYEDMGAPAGPRTSLNFIEGTNITLTVIDDAPNDQINITITSSGGGGGGDVNGSAINPTEINGTTKYMFGTQFDVHTEIASSYEWNGEMVLIEAGEQINQGNLIFLNSTGYAFRTSANSSTTMLCVGFALTGGAEGTPVPILMQGWVYNVAWSWTGGGEIFVSKTTYGAKTQTPPSASGDLVQVVAIAFDADLIYFNPDYTVLEII